MHLLSDAVELANETWDGTHLRLQLWCPSEHTGILAVYIPSQYTYRPINRDISTLDMHLLRVPLHMIEEAEIALLFAEPEELSTALPQGAGLAPSPCGLMRVAG